MAPRARSAAGGPFELSLDELRARTSSKWRSFPQDVLPLFVAEMDVALPEPVVRAVTDAVRTGDTGYPAGHAYADAFAAFAQRRYGWAPDPATMRAVPTVMTGVAAVLRAATDPAGAVVISPPVYPPFASFAADAGRGVLTAPLTDEGRLDPAALDEAFARASAGGRSAYLLCHPHNPTGTVHTAAELAALGGLAARHGVVVVSDEIHAPLVHDRSVPFVPAPAVIDDAVALVSASKAFNLAGLPAALAVPGPGAAANALVKGLPEVVGHPVSHVGTIAHTAALTHGDAWLDAVLDALAARADRLQSALAGMPGVRWLRGPGTYLAWLDLREALPGDPDPAARLLREGRVALNSGLPFGAGGQGHVRLNYATTSPILDEALCRIGEVLSH